MSILTQKLSTAVMSFTELLDEYLETSQKKNNHSKEESQRFIEVMHEIDIRCPPKE
jgi:hypothetical protein